MVINQNMIIFNRLKKKMYVILKFQYLKKNIKKNIIVKWKKIIDVIINVLNVKYIVNQILVMMNLIKILYIEIKIMQFMQV